MGACAARRRPTDRLARWLLWLLAASPASAADRPPRDLGDGQAPVAFDADWASRVRDIRNFRELQQQAGAPGRITTTELPVEFPRVVYRWEGAKGRGRLRAFVYPDGSFAAVVSPVDPGGEIILNSFGAFVCPACLPPVSACGHRPSWIPHDLHWDNFDCLHTLTGPQTVYGRDGP